MITIISGTNRPKSRTKILAEYCFDKLKTTGTKVEMVDLVDIQDDILFAEMYQEKSQKQVIRNIQDNKIVPASLLLFIVPEYNGSFPGVLKSFIDALSARNHSGTFGGKKAALIGTSTGRAGNLRGLEHLTGILNYLNVIVMPNKLPVSSIQTLIQEENELNEPLKTTLDMYLTEVIDFI